MHKNVQNPPNVTLPALGNELEFWKTVKYVIQTISEGPHLVR